LHRRSHSFPRSSAPSRCLPAGSRRVALPKYIPWRRCDMNDVKFAFRQLLKNPGFTAVTVLTLALGIGATSSVFSLIQGVLLTPPPYPNPKRIVLVTPQKISGQ